MSPGGGVSHWYQLNPAVSQRSRNRRGTVPESGRGSLPCRVGGCDAALRRGRCGPRHLVAARYR
jgi:hypothetical protein